MNVIDLPSDLLRFPVVPVVTAAILPETIRRPPLARFHKFQSIRIILFQTSDDFHGNGLFYRFQDVRDGIMIIRREYQDMNVLGHKHISPQVELMFLSCVIDGCCEGFRSMSAVQEGLPLLA
jgi:hypothetical protein